MREARDRRCASSPGGSSSDILTASAATDVARLGGAIAARLRQAVTC